MMTSSGISSYIVRISKYTAGYLNSHNDAYPLTRSSEAAAIESLMRFGKIKERVSLLHRMARDLEQQLEKLGIKVFSSKFSSLIEIIDDFFAFRKIWTED